MGIPILTLEGRTREVPNGSERVSVRETRGPTDANVPEIRASPATGVRPVGAGSTVGPYSRMILPGRGSKIFPERSRLRRNKPGGVASGVEPFRDVPTLPRPQLRYKIVRGHGPRRALTPAPAVHYPRRYGRYHYSRAYTARGYTVFSHDVGGESVTGSARAVPGPPASSPKHPVSGESLT